MNSRINVTEAMRQFAAGRTDIYTSLAYTGNALQMARHGIVQSISPEDVTTLAAFAMHLASVERLQSAGLSVDPPRTDDPAGPDGTTYPDQHMR